MKQLTDKQSEALARRCGLYAGDKRTYVDIAFKMNISPARARELVLIALDKISRWKQPLNIVKYTPWIKPRNIQKKLGRPIRNLKK